MPHDLSSLDAVIHEWNQCHGAFFQVRAKDWQQVISSQAWVHYEATTIARVPVIVAQAADERISKSTLWVSLWGRVQDADAFVEAVIAEARKRGHSRVRFGGDEFHFIAGVPAEEKSLIDALSKAGFAGDWAQDLVGPMPPNQELVSGYSFEETAPGALQAFLEKEFPGRWSREFLIWRKGNFGGEWRALRKNETILGFARIGMRDQRVPPAGLRLLGADACLGPIGIAKSERGKGLGKILLGMALGELNKREAKTLCIDWVSEAEGFYKDLGLMAVRSTKAMSYKIPESV